MADTDDNVEYLRESIKSEEYYLRVDEFLVWTRSIVKEPGKESGNSDDSYIGCGAY